MPHHVRFSPWKSVTHGRWGSPASQALPSRFSLGLHRTEADRRDGDHRADRATGPPGSAPGPLSPDRHRAPREDDGTYRRVMSREPLLLRPFVPECHRPTALATGAPTDQAIECDTAIMPGRNGAASARGDPRCPSPSHSRVDCRPARCPVRLGLTGPRLPSGLRSGHRDTSLRLRRTIHEVPPRPAAVGRQRELARVAGLPLVERGARAIVVVEPHEFSEVDARDAWARGDLQPGSRRSRAASCR